MKIICKLPARSVELYRHCPGGLCWLLSSRASTCGKSVSHSCSWVIFNLWNLFSKRSRASSTRSESARVPCQAMMFLNSLKADLKTGVPFALTAITWYSPKLPLKEKRVRRKRRLGLLLWVHRDVAETFLSWGPFADFSPLTFEVVTQLTCHCPRSPLWIQQHTGAALSRTLTWG